MDSSHCNYQRPAQVQPITETRLSSRAEEGGFVEENSFLTSLINVKLGERDEVYLRSASGGKS